MNDPRLERYLLGDLSEDEQETFEREYFRSDETFDRLQAAEDDLIDAFAAGTLASAAAARLRERLERSPGGRARLELARALREVPRAAPVPARRAAWLSLAAVLAVGLGTSFLTMRSLRHELRGARDAGEASSRRAEDLAEELALARQANTGIASRVLEPGGERDPQGVAVVTLDDGVDWIRLRLRVPRQAPPPPYGATLETAEGETLATLRGLEPREGAVDVVWPRLRPGTYVVTLHTAEPAESYTFRVD
jgi:hypothetical protein